MTAVTIEDAPRIERLGTVLSRVGLSRSTLYERISQGRFPRPFELGSAHRVGWLASEVTAAILAMAAAPRKPVAPPVQAV